MTRDSSLSSPRVAPNAAHAFGGIWRLTAQRYFTLNHWLVVLGMLALLVLFSIPVTPTRASAADGLLPWASRFYVCFLVSLLSFISSASLMRDDLRADAVDYIFTRPVRRPWFLLCRYASHVACLQIDFLLSLAVVAGLGAYWGVPDLWSAVPVLLLGQALAVIAFGAFGFFCGQLTSRYVIIGLLYAGVVEAGIGNVPTQLHHLSMVRHLLALMRSISGEGASGMTAAGAAESLGTAGSIFALLGFAVVMLAATMALFTFKELTTSVGRDA